MCQNLGTGMIINVKIHTNMATTLFGTIADALYANTSSTLKAVKIRVNQANYNTLLTEVTQILGSDPGAIPPFLGIVPIEVDDTLDSTGTASGKIDTDYRDSAEVDFELVSAV